MYMWSIVDLLSFSFHLSITIDVAVAAVLSVFTAALKLVPKFKAHGGSVRENLALQNVHVILVWFVPCSFHLSITIDVAVAAVLSVFTAALKLVPKFKAHGGSVRENLALQNVHVIHCWFVIFQFSPVNHYRRGCCSSVECLHSSS